MKNIVVCCDGTGNEISENISNVLKLYRVLRKTGKTQPPQVVFYDPGVGTLARPDPWTKFRQDAIAVLGLATGYGLDDNVLAAYEFLVTQYEDGDEIYLFGFSRGAYTARVLAGLVHRIGLLSPHQWNLAGAALTAYKQTGPAIDPIQSAMMEESERGEVSGQPVPSTKDDRASQFARIVSSRWPTIKFVGVWDTVASVIVPRPDRFYAFSLQTLANTRNNPSVRIFRQAIAIDERRRMFRLDAWDEPQTFMHNRFSATNNAEPQDAQQVWFSGVHADIGGGYPEQESGLSKFPLIWMIDEAVKHGLAVDPRTVNQLAWGVQRKGSPFSYVPPDIRRDPHDSMSNAWRLLELWPKADKYKEWAARKSLFGHYIPSAEPRFISPEAFVHQSVVDRMAAIAKYKPENFPESPRVVPMSGNPA
ncbi:MULTISPECIES: DUF2235 domain-containing protein [unclassified Mesorhizobium]|uniref:DUF2235 domain-containing protein n=1 Tax=unclassified Mesorhizobium TaxID=325217 RepID=UPI00109339B0|nr:MULTISPECIES: DUF2235 domain-containing protein [unclassified Mesorhizobium]TGS46286.1 DUF2235 domain-containing protein [Mesorhizobium sp. M8A.F.Ca.ET.182.01.1.1]TGS81744.1 DUF2235 domain-containing protein [Mesorhizobium sp. M8A.F.Ca.ET.181.01.1.1]